MSLIVHVCCFAQVQAITHLAVNALQIVQFKANTLMTQHGLASQSAPLDFTKTSQHSNASATVQTHTTDQTY